MVKFFFLTKLTVKKKKLFWKMAKKSSLSLKKKLLINDNPIK